jgi:hypothetical protein
VRVAIANDEKKPCKGTDIVHPFFTVDHRVLLVRKGVFGPSYREVPADDPEVVAAVETYGCETRG